MPNFQLFVFRKRMSTSELSVDDSSSSGSSEIEFSDFEMEVEEFETLSDGSSSHGHDQSALVESEEASSLSAPVPSTTNQLQTLNG